MDSRSKSNQQSIGVAPTVDLFAQKNTFDQVLADKSFIEKFGKLSAALEIEWPVISSELKRSASKEFDRYKASTVFGLQGNKIKILGSKVAEIEMNMDKLSVSADLFYRIEIKPSFKKGKQLRKDIYVIGLHGSSFISLGSEVRITFFREFDSKVDALFAGLPYGVRHIPRNADDVINKLKIEDGVRIEVLGNLQISDSISKIMNESNLSALLGYDLFQGLFMLDIYKYSANEVRARFMGTVNRGTLRGSADLNWMSKYKVAKILPRRVKELFEVNFQINFSKSFNFFDEYPIETHVADYFFRFDTGLTPLASISKNCNFRASGAGSDPLLENHGYTAKAAFDELIQNIHSGKFIALFNPNVKEAALSAVLLQNASQAETIACQDQNLPPEKKRVLYFFKGRMASDIFSLNFGPKISQLIRNTKTVGRSEVFVASLEKDQEFNYYLLLNSSSKFKNSYVFGRWENEYVTDLDALYFSDKDKNIKHFLDFVKRIQYRDKNLSESNLKDIYGNINRSIPQNFPDREKLLELLPVTEQRDGLINLVYLLSDKIVFEMEAIDKIELYNRLYQYLDKHPEKHLMVMPADNLADSSGPTFTEYVTDMHSQLIKFSDSNADSKARFVALRQLMNDPVFTDYVFREFLPSLIPAQAAEEAMSVQLSVQAANLPYKEIKIGQNQYSSVYGAVLLFRSLLNDRSLDLRLETTMLDGALTGKNPLRIQGFRID